MKYNEITHVSHPQHKLKFEYTEVPFKCDGCKEAGIGSRYKCTACDYDLHLHCALPSPTLAHPFYTKCSFQFLLKPPGSVARYCNVCEKDVTGFVYHCSACGFDLHPCCAKLPMVLDDGQYYSVALYLETTRLMKSVSIQKIVQRTQTLILYGNKICDFVTRRPAVVSIEVCS